VKGGVRNASNSEPSETSSTSTRRFVRKQLQQQREQLLQRQGTQSCLAAPGLGAAFYVARRALRPDPQILSKVAGVPDLKRKGGERDASNSGPSEASSTNTRCFIRKQLQQQCEQLL